MTIIDGPYDLAVLGAGPAGLAAAARAAAAGRRVVVFEREPAVGGVARSVDLAGVRVDLGSHRLHRTTHPAILAHLRDLLGDDLQKRPRRGRIRLGGRWLPFPLSPAALTALPPEFALRVAFDTLTGWARRPRQDTFAERIRAGLGPTMLARFYGPYATKLWGLAADAVDGEQARVRVGAATPRQLLLRVLRGRDPDARTFYYPRRGFGQIAEALAADAVARGVDLRVGTTVTAVTPGDVVCEVRTDRTSTTVARTVFSTIPLPVLARLVDGAPTEVVDAAGRLRTRAMVLVYLVAAQDRVTDFDAHYLPEAWTPVTRISEPKNYRDGRPGRDDSGDPRDRTVLCAEIPCDRGDAVFGASPTQLSRVVQDAMSRAGFPSVRVDEVRVERLPNAYPVYDRGFAEHVGVIDGWLRRQPGVVTFGRQGLFVHDNSHHALSMAWAAVDALDESGRVDAQAWRRSRERFRDHVVED